MPCVGCILNACLIVLLIQCGSHDVCIVKIILLQKAYFNSYTCTHCRLPANHGKVRMWSVRVTIVKIILFQKAYFNPYTYTHWQVCIKCAFSVMLRFVYT